jgi:drug/metabolite transporter (DMT)-like permease
MMLRYKLMSELFKKNQVVVGMGAVGLAALLWSLDGVFLRPKFYNFPASIIVYLEHLLGLVLLSPVIFINWKIIIKINKKTWLVLLWVSLFGGLIGTLMITKAFFSAIDGEISFATVIILQKLQPIFAILMAQIILKEKMKSKFYLWAGMAIGASYLLAFSKDGFSFNLFELENKAAWFSLLAAFAFGSSTVFGKKLVSKLSFLLATALRFGVTMILAGLLLVVMGNYLDIVTIDTGHWKLLLVITFSSGAVAMCIYYFGLKKIPASLATIAELFWPLSAIFLDYLINKSVLTPIQIVATIFLLISFYKITDLSKR